ncbi:MAG: GNAT family N-acetyltransferase [Cellulosilyticaceae bacterium]
MIREFRLADLDEVMNIWLSTNISAHHFIDESYWKNNFEFVKQVLPTSQIKVFVEGDVIKGFIGVIDQYIAGLFVLEAYQSQGIGKQLVEAAKKFSPILHIDVYLQNEKALTFYKKNGFQVISEKENMDTKQTECFMVWNQ